MARPLAVSAVLALTTVNYFGVQKTTLLIRAIVTVVLVALLVVVAAGLLGGEIDVGHLRPLLQSGPYGIVQSADFLFFAGCARIATLGEEVVVPACSIPRASGRPR